MKNKFNRIISSLLVIAALASLFSVFAFANDGDSNSESVSSVNKIYDRAFDEGWDLSNGPNAKDTYEVTSKNHNFGIDYERTVDYDYNYFARFEASNASEGYMEFNFQRAGQIQTENGTVIKISLKADDLCNMVGNPSVTAKIFYGTTALGLAVNLLAIKDGALYTYKDKDGTILAPLGELNNDWVDVAFVFDWDRPDFNYTVYYGKDYSESVTVSYAYTNAIDKGLNYLRLGVPASNNSARIGASFCVDNLHIYHNAKTIFSNEELATVSPTYGQLVDYSKAPTIEILSGKTKSKTQTLEQALCMKVGVDYALFKNEKRPILTKLDEESGKVSAVYGAPEKDKDGNVMIPFEILKEYINFEAYLHAGDTPSYDVTTETTRTNLAAGRKSASVNGKRIELTAAPAYITGSGGNQYFAIALDDVALLFPGWIAIYDNMGLIIIYEDATPQDNTDNVIVNRNDDLGIMVDIMKKFIFDTVTEDADGNVLRDNEKYTQTGEKIYADVNKNTAFLHPYIGAKQSEFDRLYDVYREAIQNAEAKAFLDTLVKEAEAFYREHASLDAEGAYAGINPDKIPVNVYADGVNPGASNPDAIQDTDDGYDPENGHLKSIVGYTENLLSLAFAYQVTRDYKYAGLAYDWAIALGEWSHWGPGHFVDCAEATMYYAMAYDWLYNAFKEIKGDDAVKAVAKVIFEKGVHQGYNASLGKDCANVSNKVGIEQSYTESGSNNNAVCSAGMIIASLAIMDGNVSDVVSSNGMTANEEIVYLAGNNIIGLMNNGLDIYAPDGSYIESATYWEYGTNALFKLVMALESAAGTSYGFMDVWGMDTTCYYACHIESSDGNIWNYHDGGPDGFTNGELLTLDTHMFNFVAKATGDSNLASIRNQQLTRSQNTKAISIFDMLYYPFDGIKEKAELSLDYHMDGIDAFVARDSWKSGAMYTGLMGGANDANYGQLDSGNFVYHNKGIVWFMDLGSENNNVHGYFSDARNNYYRSNAEGQNVLIVSTSPELPSGGANTNHLPFGQDVKGGGDIIKTFVNEHGSYVVMDNLSVYSGNVYSAMRGILVTNDRKTVVIQDEVTLSTAQDVKWIAHTAQKITLSEDGKTAFLTSTDASGKTYTLRASLVSTVKTCRFSTISAQQSILEDTYDSDESSSLGGAPEYSRKGIQRLVVDVKKALRFEIAVVLEMVDDENTTEPVGYKWKTFTGWVPSLEDFTSKDDVSVENNIREDAVESDIKSATSTASKLFKDKIAFTEKLDEFYAALTTVEYTLTAFENFSAVYEDDYFDYLKLRDEYNEFAERANVTVEDAFNLMGAFSGIVEEEYVEEEVEEGEEGEEGEETPEE